MYTRTGRLALAAAVILIVLGGITLWPPGSNNNGKWWLGPPAAWGQEVLASLQNVKALVYREQAIFVGGYGSTHISHNWSRWYKAMNAWRRDTYYDDELVGIMWEAPDANAGVLRYDVSFEFRCYTLEHYEGDYLQHDPVDRLRHCVALLEQADRLLGTEIFDGHECVGFEVGADKHGDNAKERIDRIWFDVETKLPVRIEKHGRPITNHPEQTFTFVEDQFKYCVEIPVDEFEPQIPEGFVNTHPDNIRAARELEEKGEMVYADVPESVKDDFVAALDQTKTVAYRQGGSTWVTLARHAWRQDHFEGDRLTTTEWFVIEQDDMAPTSLDFNDKNFRLVQTSVDYDARTYTHVERGKDTWPGHPMDRIAFLIGHIDLADRKLEDTVVDGIECFGFDISAKKYGTNPDGAFHRLWFDKATNLPVRMEVHWPYSDGTGVSTTVREQFDWDPELPEDFFIPQVPPNFTQVEQ